MTLLDQLWDIYQLEDWHETRLTRQEADDYHERMLKNGNCFTIFDGDILAGYTEYYILYGVCYIYNMFVRPEYRHGKVMRELRNKLFGTGCKMFIGNRNRGGKRYAEAQLRRSDGEHEAKD